jgi:hypothetical protein
MNKVGGYDSSQLFREDTLERIKRLESEINRDERKTSVPDLPNVNGRGLALNFGPSLLTPVFAGCKGILR